ncbi:MAG TPA: DUF2079 domain-containing protein [Candidatus Acidoferrales bacterium]|nr:DUF2079 domain-containing protein [Candidatus Acidoferrales bacterium]
MTSALAASRRRGDPWLLGVGLLFGLLSAVYGFLLFWRYDIFRSGVDDGIFTQIANGAFSGFSSTVEGSANHLLVHFSPILLLTIPFVHLFHGVLGLSVLQALLVAAVVFPIWGMAVTRFPKPLAFIVTVIAACYPVLSAEAVQDFHELAFAPVLTACLVLALDRRAWRYAIVVALVLVCVKEDQFVSLAFIGVLLAVTDRADGQRRRCGLWIAAIAVSAALLYFGVVRRLIDPNFPYWSFHYYQWWWFPPTPNGFVTAASLARPLYVLGALVPLAFLPLGSRYALFAIPGFAEVLLSHEAVAMSMSIHYTATWSGYLLCAFVDGASVLNARSPVAAKAALTFAFLASMWVSTFQSPVLPSYALYRWPAPEDRERDLVLQSIPSNASVWSHDPFFARLSMNPQAATTMKSQAYLVFDLKQDAAEYASAPIRRLVDSGRYSLLLQKDDIAILKKR